MMKYNLLAASMLASGLAMPAMAQDQASMADKVQDSASISDIVVTAERRSSTVQKSSLSLQVLSAADVAEVARPADLNFKVPGIQIGSGGPNPQVYIRGIGDQARTSLSQSAILFNIDGVALARPSASGTNFFDLQRIEVLKGPQGTLYGRNASGGVINLITARPVIGDTGGFVVAEAGNYGLLTGEAALNVSLSSVAALRVSGKIVERDGYLSDGGQDQRTRAGRAKLLLEPSNDVSLMVTADVSHIGGVGSGVVHHPARPGRSPWQSTTDVRDLAFPFLFTANTLPYTGPTDRMIDADLWGINAELNADLGPATLTVIPAHRSQKSSYVSYNSNFRFAEDLDSNANSVEVRLANDSDLINWLVGGYYFREKAGIGIYPTQGNFNAAVQLETTTEAKAAFASVTVKASDTFRVLGGIRYTDEKSGGVIQNGTGSEPDVPFAPVGLPFSIESAQSKKVNWKAGLELDVSSNSMVYANISTGFKAGGFNVTPCGKPPFEPENVTAYLAGSRNRLLGGLLQVNGEVFLNKAKGLQLTALRDVCNATQTGTTSGLLTFNVGKATIYGGNIDVVWRPTVNDNLHFAAEYLHTNGDDFTFTQNGPGAYGAGLQSLCAPTAIGGGRFSINCNGLPLQRAPKWTLQGDYSHKFDLANNGTITPKIMGQYSASRWLDSAYGPNALAPSYFRVNAEIAYANPENNWTLAFYVTNITNEKVYTSGSTIGAVDAATGLRRVTANIEPPRMFGGRLRVNF